MSRKKAPGKAYRQGISLIEGLVSRRNRFGSKQGGGGDVSGQ